ncbi:hypothetical protein CSA56_13030 [candidate division KSB3 bacterium]|uniref:Glycosyl transferase family 1 n=1 Tax=candidate division KSB3 bacterium TaxID=2044937 RepID=A0A2G6KDQ5_9BACT|nr:MAG: hypothetical protein CSA56_13030 [candidate division KSB3 bacterium]
MKILSFTTLWPNPMQPFYGLFNRERIRTLAKLCDLRVVAPVPWFMSVKWLGRYYYQNYCQLPGYEKSEDLEVFHPQYLVIPKLLKFSDAFLMHASLRTFLRNLRKEFAFDLIDAYYAYPDGVAASYLAEALGVPYTVSVLGSDITLFGKERLRGTLIRRSLQSANRVLCVSDSLKAELITTHDIPSEKIDVIENGVDCQKFCPLPKIDARRQLDLPADAHILLSVGHLRELKGFHLLVEALHTLQHSKTYSSPLKLLIVGGDYPWDPTYKDRLVRQIQEYGLQEHVVLAGAKRPDELHYWYSAADVFCLVSSREGCPNVILESLACGTPIVATPVGDIPKLVPRQDLGILVERNVESIRRGIVEALEQTWNHDGIVEYAQQFSWERTSAKICTIYEGLIAGASRAQTSGQDV